MGEEQVQPEITKEVTPTDAALLPEHQIGKIRCDRYLVAPSDRKSGLGRPKGGKNKPRTKVAAVTSVDHSRSPSPLKGKGLDEIRQSRTRAPRTRGLGQSTQEALKALPNKFIRDTAKIKDLTCLLPVVQNLAAAGCTEGEIGMVLGSTSKSPEAMIKRLRNSSLAFEAAWRNGIKAADVQLVRKLFQTAMGYQYEEQTVEEKADKFGDVQVFTKIVRKYEKPSIEALMFLIQNRLREEFRNTQRIEVDRKSIDITADLTTKQMSEIGGRLVEHLLEQKKKVESTVKDNFFRSIAYQSDTLRKEECVRNEKLPSEPLLQASLPIIEAQVIEETHAQTS
jgi:hypothetical protein